MNRKELLRKSERNLLRECKKHNISTKAAENKRELVELIMTRNVNKKHIKKKKMNRHRSHSIAETLTNRKNTNKIKPKNTDDSIKKKKNNLLLLDCKYNEKFPELRMKSLIKLNSIHLNESIDTKMDDLFIENMSISEIASLQINDMVDFRGKNGFIFGATIINKQDSKLTVSYKNNMGKIEIIKCDYNKELYRFSKYLSISKRSSVRMNYLKIGNTVDINPRHIINEWMVGEVINKDFKSGQVQIEYSHNNKKCLYWTHTDNTLEIAAYLTHYDMTNILNIYLDDNDEEKIEMQWNLDDVINWFYKIKDAKFNHIKYKQFVDAIKIYNIGYKQLIQINDLTLKILGIDDENDRKIIINEIKIITGNIDKEKQHETELIRLKQQIFIQSQEIELLKQQQKTQKIVNESKRNPLKTAKSSRNGYVSKTPKAPKKSKKALKSTWKSGHHSFKSNTPKNHKKTEWKFPDTHNDNKLKEKKKKKKSVKKKKCDKTLKKQKSLRYDENLVFEIKGLSALDLFVQEYEQQKKEEEEKKKKKEIEEIDGDISTDDDFDEIHNELFV